MNNKNLDKDKPLAARLRPQDLNDFVGQEHLLGEGKALRKLIEADKISSMIFWGPPGVGKTTLAGIIAKRTQAQFVNFSAVTGSIKEIREVMKSADETQNFGGKTILFVDEIHRFNKAQQDAFLPFVEKGSIILIGATTENPSFEINGALLSRCKVFVLKPLSPDDIFKLLKHALTSPLGFGDEIIEVEDEILTAIAEFANGDARTALSTLEMAVLNGENVSATPLSVPDISPYMGDEKNESESKSNNANKIIITRETLEQCTSRKSLLYDKNGEEHYNLISALHKSMRNSDPDAAVYWLARMLEAGEDPLYIARRVVRFASEDIGLAEPNALSMAVAAYQACHFIGMPECTVHLTQAVIHMSIAPKSNALDIAYMRARKDALEHLAEPVPEVIRNAPTKLMKELGYGKGYQYAHDAENNLKLTNMQCLPDALKGREYYSPTEQGQEAKYKARLDKIKEWKHNNLK